MTVRLDPVAAAPELMKDWHRMTLALSSNLDPKLTELVKLRASQINGCANCVNIHTKMALDHGELPQRISLVSVWRDAPCFSDRERAALAWTEALTRLCEAHTHESAYEDLKAHFSPEEQVRVTLAVVVINGWNRLAVGFGGWADPAAVKAKAAAAA